MVAVTQDRYSDLLDLDGIRILKAERHLREFVKQAWHVVEPATPYLHNWHVDVICEHLEATLPPRGASVATHQCVPVIRNLLINMPPRFLKSLIVSVFFPAWVWGPYGRPDLRFLYASYARDLSSEHSQLCRMVIESEWYQARWGHVYQLSDDDNLKTRFSNTARGQRIATSVGASVTGFGGDFVIVDDPHNVQKTESIAERTAAVRWWNKAMSTRLNNPETGVRIVVMQRVHEDDVAGSVLSQGDYVHLNLPMEYEPESVHETAIGWTDPRTEPGELLHPERMGEAQVAAQKRRLGSYDYAAQYQQRPSPAEGGMFKRHWWRFWKPRKSTMSPIPVRQPDGSIVEVAAVDAPAWWDSEVQSWDMTFKETTSGSYVVGLVGATSGANGYLIERYRERVDFPDATRALVGMSNRYPDTDAKLVEEKANGAAVIATLKGKVPGLIATQPDGSKEARAASSTARVEAGNWYLPHPDLAPWVWEFIDELASFPTGRYDDQVDAFSQLDRYVFRGWETDESGAVLDDVAAWFR